MTKEKIMQIGGSQNAQKSWFVIGVGLILTIFTVFGLDVGDPATAAKLLVDAIFSFDLTTIITVAFPTILTPIMKWIKGGAGFSLKGIWERFKLSGNFRTDVGSWVIAGFGVADITLDVAAINNLFDVISSVTSLNTGSIVAIAIAVLQLVNSFFHMAKPAKVIPLQPQVKVAA